MEDVTALPLVLTLATLLVLIVVLLGCTRCFRNLFPKPDEEAIVSQDEMGIENHENLFGDFTPPAQNTPYNDQVQVEALPDISHLRLNQHVSSLTPVLTGPSLAEANIKLLNDPSIQFPRTQLSYVDELGSGWFGKVLLGEARKIQVGVKKTKVVVKELKDTASREEQIRFLTDVQVHRELRHPNMLILLGQCIDTIPFLLILEHAPLGDLKGYLMKHREERQSLALRDAQLRWACDLASGLTLMHQAGFIFKDFAARNCLVSSLDSLKIGDYGISQDKYKEDYYLLPSVNQLVPIRWLPPECFEVNGLAAKPKLVTKESNVWSFGVVLWELSTGALLPYINFNDEEVLKEVIINQKTKLEMPELQVKYIGRWWEIMQLCWQSFENRPTMQHILELLNHLKSHKDKSDREEFQERWDSLKRSNSTSSGSALVEIEGCDKGQALTTVTSDATILKPQTSSIVVVEHHTALPEPSDEVNPTEVSPSLLVSQNELVVNNLLNGQHLVTPNSNQSSVAMTSGDLLKTPPNTPIEEGYLSKMSKYDEQQSHKAAEVLSQELVTENVNKEVLPSSTPQGLETANVGLPRSTLMDFETPELNFGLPQSPEHLDALAAIQKLNTISFSDFTSLNPVEMKVNGTASPSNVMITQGGGGDTKVLNIPYGVDDVLSNIADTSNKLEKEDEKLLQDDALETLNNKPRKSSIRHSNSKQLEDSTFKTVTFEDDPTLTSIYTYSTEPTSPSNQFFSEEISDKVSTSTDKPNGVTVVESSDKQDDIELGVKDGVSENLVDVVKENLEASTDASLPEEILLGNGNGDANGADNFLVPTDLLTSEDQSN